MKSKFIGSIDPRTFIAAVIMLLLDVVSFIVTGNWILFAVFIVIILIYIVSSRLELKKSENAVTSRVQALNSKLCSAAGEVMANFPMPAVVVNSEGEIKWYNEKFFSIFEDETLFDKKISELLPGLELGFALNEKASGQIEITFKDKHFSVFKNTVKVEDSEKLPLTILYFIDRTEYFNMKREREGARIAAAYITLDSYDELMQNAKETEKAQVMSQIEALFARWLEGVKGSLKHLERDRYYLVFEERFLAKFIESKFDILDNAREVLVSGKYPVTLSIGIGIQGEDIIANDDMAIQAIDMALGRGGDQVVIKTPQGFQFYGGKSKALERRTKVRARVLATALGELVKNSDKVLIMGHRYADLDSFGASVGIARIAMSMNKPAYIVLNRNISLATESMERIIGLPEYTDRIIMPANAQDMITPKTLLVIVDTHRAESLEEPNIYKNCHTVALIDHHRRSTNYIEDAALTFHEAFASSTCEMVAELLQYVGDANMLLKEEAEALLAGIVLDTKNFTIKTGVRTFEAATFLRRAGADTVEVKKMLQSSFESYQAKMEIVAKAQFYRDGIAIAAWDKGEIENALSVVSQAADEMLSIEGITVSFVLYKFPDYVQISARSLDSFNVQMILEKIGGGGHTTLAGAQLKDVTVDEALQKLIAAIDSYLEENEYL